MAHVLIMPRQGNTVESCIIVEWKKKEGDAVDSDTVVCEVETDKATFEVPAGASGTVLKVLHGEGDDVPVLQPIMVIGNAGEDWHTQAEAASASAAGSSAATDASPQASTSDSAAQTFAPSAEQTTQASASQASAGGVSADGADSYGASGADNAHSNSAHTDGAHTDGAYAGGADGFIAVSPRARALALKEIVDVRTLSGSGAQGRIIEADVMRALAERPPLTSAAKAALRAGSSLPASGSGIGGRVTLADIAALNGADASAQSFAPLSLTGTGIGTLAGAGETGASAADEYTDTPIKGIRKVIAERMMSSLANSAQFTLNASANAVRMQKLRARFKTSEAELALSKVTVNDLVLFLVSRLLKEFPFLNAVKKDGVVRQYKNVHLGMAVDTPRGLMVPVIRNADKMSLAQISAQAKFLASECQSGSIKPDMLSGSTFSVTNLGNTGIESFTPVLNAPEIAILGVCGIQPKPAANEQGGFDIVPHLSFSLTIDHAVVDGAPAARFLKALCTALSDIDIWIAK